jgi:hypothetical protein
MDDTTRSTPPVFAPGVRRGAAARSAVARRGSRAFTLAATPIAAVLVALAVAIAGPATPGAGAAASDEPMKLLPSGAVVALESSDLGALLGRWLGSDLRRRFDASAAKDELGKGMLSLRLADRLGALERLAGFELDAERLRLLVGRRAAIGLFDLGETSFVLVAEIADRDLAKTPFAAVAKRAPRRRYQGVEYFLASDGRARGPSLAFALIGRHLVVGNSLEPFHDALVLVAQAEGVALAPGTKVPVSIFDGNDYQALRRASPAQAPGRVFVRLDAIAGTHHFNDFWLWNWAGWPLGGAPSPAPDGIATSLLSLTFDEDGAHETRAHLVADPSALRAQLPDSGGRTGAAPSVSAGMCRRLPAAAITSVEAADPDAGRIGARLERLLPALGPGGPAAAPALARALAPAAPGRWIELVTVDGPGPGARVLAPRRGGAIAVSLGAPDKLIPATFEAALADALTARAGHLVPVGFAQAPGPGLAARQLALPLVDPSEWALTVIPPHPGASWLIVATSADRARALAEQLSQTAGPAVLLDPQSPRCQRLDAAVLASTFSQVGLGLTGRPGFAADAESRFLLQVIPELVGALGLTAVDAVTTRRGDVLVEDIDFRW